MYWSWNRQRRGHAQQPAGRRRSSGSIYEHGTVSNLDWSHAGEGHYCASAADEPDGIVSVCPYMSDTLLRCDSEFW